MAGDLACCRHGSAHETFHLRLCLATCALSLCSPRKHSGTLYDPCTPWYSARESYSSHEPLCTICLPPPWPCWPLLLSCLQAERAWQVYHELRDAGVQPSLVVFTAAVHACSGLPAGAGGRGEKNGEGQGEEEGEGEGEGEEEQPANLERAMSIYEDMMRDGVKPDEVRCVRGSSCRH